jgi:hypothetical protein
MHTAYKDLQKIASRHSIGKKHKLEREHNIIHVT